MTKRAGEFELIARHFRPLAEGFDGALGLADDAALIRFGDARGLVVTTDAVVAGVHFLAGEAPQAIAGKALRVNLSDLAAMGARPLAYVLALALPATVDEPWLARFAGALGEDQRSFGIALAGGDVVATPGPLAVVITALGEVEPARALRRSGAAPGDAVFVSGSIGDAALGLRALQGGLGALPESAREALVARHRLPQPRIALGQRLAGVASAAIDVSDGLVADLGHICEASGVGAELRAPAVPLSEAARMAIAIEPALLARVLTGGDDYELLFTARPSARATLAAAASEAGVPVSEIGVVTRGAGVRVVDAEGASVALARGGYEHF